MTSRLSSEQSLPQLKMPGPLPRRGARALAQRSGLLQPLCLTAALLVCGLASRSFAQQASSLPAQPQTQPDAPALASVSGTVVDPAGSVVPGAHLVLVCQKDATERSLVAGSNGEFAFSQLPPGPCRLKVSAPGFGSFLSSDIAVHAGDVSILPDVHLPLSSDATSVQVYADRDQIAEEQVRLAVDQRVMGVLPNFYSSYDWHAPSLGAKQKFELALHAVTDPVVFAGYGFVAGVEQANNGFPGYGQGAQGFGKRYGAAMANDTIGRMMGSAILPSLLRQDPRYFFRGTGTVRSRALYAISAAVICRGDNGRWQPNYSHVLGSLAAGGLSNLYYPSGERGASLTVLNTLVGTAGNAANNLVREFLLRRLTPRVPDYHNGAR